MVARDEHALRVVAAVQALAAAKLERDAAILAMLKAGASFRVTAAVSGMSVSQTQNIAKAGGWPDKAELARREAERVERHKWDYLLEQHRTPPTD